MKTKVISFHESVLWDNTTVPFPVASRQDLPPEAGASVEWTAFGPVPCLCRSHQEKAPFGYFVCVVRSRTVHGVPHKCEPL